MSCDLKSKLRQIASKKLKTNLDLILGSTPRHRLCKDSVKKRNSIQISHFDWILSNFNQQKV